MHGPLKTGREYVVTVKELIETLQELPQDAIVVMSRDSEGNGFSLLSDIESNCMFFEGEIKLAELTPELRSQGYEEEDVGEEGDRAVCFWP